MLLRTTAAILTLLAGAVLFWAIAIGSNGPSSAERTTSPQEREAVRIEKRLGKDPTDASLLHSVMEAWIHAGAERLEGSQTRTEPIPSAVPEDYEAGLRAWSRYLRQTGGEAAADLAEMAAVTSFQLVEIGSTDPGEATANAAGAVRAQKITCKHSPSLYTLSDLAVYEYFNGEDAAGDRAARRAATDVPEPRGPESRSVIDQLNEYKERGEKFVARVKKGFETLEETGKEELDTPIKGYGSHAGINGYEPAAD